jgi:DNA-binding transcriptional ArsR family regulator
MTTQLARDLHQSPSTISEHLTVLRGNGLLVAWRADRGVLYRRTPLASSLMAEAQGRVEPRQHPSLTECRETHYGRA